MRIFSDFSVTGFGFFLDRELTQSIESLTLVRELGEPRIKRMRLFFGNPVPGQPPLISNSKERNIIISSKRESFNLGSFLLSGPRHAIEMWFTVEIEGGTCLSINNIICYPGIQL